MSLIFSSRGWNFFKQWRTIPNELSSEEISYAYKHLFIAAVHYTLYQCCHNFFGTFQITRLCYPNFLQQKILAKSKQQFHEK